ncbi:MAG: tRNA (N6-isopentenyl adenosine(37)-C2)-methylthiotransferase MiaB [Geobacteraceae bacterium GWC2_55_20]|nr:MAG: tRNA (N6-isopentenyl adenosine(37)-C2)-methylthiotransferase MiaB [Geobacteraceae bacterium GWC2_55_20]OGU19911.1 MAG: tRNA (N6-isopentenyl adenosine(37)-C2)-methylthiotransferase MiaB [Geobacteraceae bacterium GWF2_54_21]HBA72101.1 tRNA (N6-isopentenyl adenosine(37)-C2)-methylthiotransferase MiaB [Geobacter sp.]
MIDKLIYMETFGCQMNVNDSERIVTMLSDLGYVPTNDPSVADMIMLNTCSVRGGAEEKVYKRLQNLRIYKRDGKSQIIAVGGCVAQQEGEELLNKFPYLDLVFGTHNLHLLPDMVRGAEQGQRRSETSFIDNDQRLDLFPSIRAKSSLSRFVTVMQGCDNFCSYCIVPYVRGREISRRSADILAEIRQLADEGVREVVLLGQNVNSYGLKAESEPSFAELIRQVAEVPEIERIRFTTSHPKDMSDDLIACFGDIPKLCGQIHLPAQSGSDAVLKLMKRGYSRESYLDKVSKLKAVRPGIVITGDIIVGFPGESDDDFEQTLSLVEEVRYIDLFTFVYSPRPGTKAAELAEELTRNQKLARLDRLMTLQKRINLEICREYVGGLQTVLVEGKGKLPGQVSGKADNCRIVNFVGDTSLIGSFVQVRIAKAYPNSLLGELEK